MSNSTNLHQLEFLVNIMEKNPDIGNGFTTTREKEDIKIFWKKTETELNSLGPPIKSIFEWKKVWFDKKKYIRNKLSENLKHKKATGGGPFKEFKFSKLEEAIISICSMRESVEGCPNTATFGLPSCAKKKRNVETQFKENSPPLQNCSNVIADLNESASSIQIEPEPVINNIHTPNKSKRKRGASMTSQECLEQELLLQKAISMKIEEAVDSMGMHHQETNESFKKIYRSLDKIYVQQKLILQEMKRHNMQTEEQRRLKYEDIKRHNNKMQNLRLREIESKIKFKQDLIQIEEEKLRKM